jgi:hypothetical protein
LQCLQAAKSFFNNSFSLSTEGWVAATVICCTEAISALRIACKILFLDVDGWNLEAARQIFDFPAVVQQLASAITNAAVYRRQRAMHTTEIKSQSDDGQADDIHRHQLASLMTIKTWFEHRVAAESSGLPPLEADFFMPDMWSGDENDGSSFFDFAGSQQPSLNCF